MSEASQRRRGGRDARRHLRSQPIAREEAAVRPGLESDRYKPLAHRDMERIHQTALALLERVGIGDSIPSCVELLTARGCTLGDDGRLRFPRALVEDTLASCGRDFVLCGRDPVHDMQPSGNRVYFGTGGAAVHVVDPFTGDYRDSLLKDLYDAARIVDACEHIHYCQRPMVARDMEDPRDLDINTLYATVSGTTKHVGTSMVHPDHVRECLDIVHTIAGGEDKWRARPFVSQSNCFVVPPMKWAEDACRCLEVAVRGGMPVLLLSAGQAGATAPAAIAGAVAQAVAECLAGLCYVNAIVPGAPAIWGPWPFVSDLRTGAMSGGSGEQALITAACAQMGHFYNLSVGSAAGMCDAKLPDVQAGAEKGVTAALAAMAGVNMLYECAGMHASLLGYCLESIVIDNDMLGAINRNVRGIEVNDDTLSLDTITSVCLEGPGHYLGHDQTLALMQKEYLYPQLGDRTSPKEWNEQDRPDIVRKAHAKVKDILANHFSATLDADIDAAIRAGHNICLPREVMRARP